MQIESSLNGLRARLKSWRQQQQTIALVPTMGNLHAGHLSLLEKARTLADKVVVSIFINPLQFDDPTDLAAYPRTIQADIQQLSQSECDLLFTPDPDLMYPLGQANQTKIQVPGVDDKLCGLARPGHFDGVATVVTKLFNVIQPDMAIFGEKDYQQLLLIEKLVTDLNLSLNIVAAPTCREADGLAMSSRNSRLSEQHRQKAPMLYQELVQIRDAVLAKSNRDYAALCQAARERLTKAGFDVDYLEIRNENDLENVGDSDIKPLRVLVAARLGSVRLIDNIPISLSE
ncbi:Pantoate--beta-alanine ligase [Methylophaga frappieri]|uniref:Pantothenate synthetase n=1 Tax=Methylophaga frappieri (strain ATCC BAA-2434 / DSM 25690 / JAM7) TaxID=754477 RepID=I1YKY3_METFJ|nr:pantoate--beta-alanine ligase [Methylophaga frappieri]AFJ03576.1 Pantoate--beta-alanine ligase [Methylophaga frappieri]